MKRAIPNILTLANLAAGLIGIVAIFNANFWLAAYMVAASLIFDFLDGFVARLLNVHSELGKQLDSLADMVSFGVVPGMLVFHLFKIEDTGFLSEFLSYSAFLIPLFSALRLGKFNIDTRQSDYFIGMPTPANTLLWFSLTIYVMENPKERFSHFLVDPWSLAVLALITSLLLVAEIPLLSLKVKNLKWADNRGQYILLILILILALLLGFRALLFIIPLYLVLSLIFKPGKKI